MKRKIIIYSVIAVALSVFLASLALAECQPGKTEITIINPAGRAIEICVPDAVIEEIRQGAANSGAQIISAICPCFSQEDLDNMLPLYCTASQWQSDIPGESCNSVKCFDQGGSGSFFIAIEAPTGATNCITTLEFPGPDSIKPNGCWTSSTGPVSPISEDEADACIAILNTFVP